MKKADPSHHGAHWKRQTGNYYVKGLSDKVPRFCADAATKTQVFQKYVAEKMSFRFNMGD